MCDLFVFGVCFYFCGLGGGGCYTGVFFLTGFGEYGKVSISVNKNMM